MLNKDNREFTIDLPTYNDLVNEFNSALEEIKDTINFHFYLYIGFIFFIDVLIIYGLKK